MAPAARAHSKPCRPSNDSGRSASVRKRLAAAVVAAAATLVLGAPPARGQVFWDGGAGTAAWGTATNWSPDALPGTTADVVLPAPLPLSSVTIDLGGVTRSVRSLKLGFSNTNTAQYTLNNGTLNLRALTSAAPNNNIVLQQPGTLTINANLTLGDPATSGGLSQVKWDAFTSGASLVINGSVAKANAAQTVDLFLNNISGDILLTGTSVAHNDTYLSGSARVTYRPSAPGRYGFGTGVIHAPNGFTFSGSTGGVYTLTNNFHQNGEFLTLESFGGANPTFRLEGGPQSFDPLTIRTSGTNNGPAILEYASDVSADLGLLRLNLLNDTAAPARISGSVISPSGNGFMSITGRGRLLISGPNNSYKSTTFGGQLFVDVASGSRLGTADVSLTEAVRLRLNALSNLPGTTAVTSASTDVLTEFPGTARAAAAARLKTTYAGVFGLTGEPTGLNLQSLGLSAAYVGAASDLAIHDTFAPHGGIYRLSGGWGGATLTLAGDVLTGPTNALLHGNRNGSNTVIDQPQSFGGGATLAGGTLTLRAAGALGAGKTTVNGATVRLQTAGALGGAGTQLIGGTLVAEVPGAVDLSRLTFTGGTLSVAHADALRATAAAPVPTVTFGNAGTLELDPRAAGNAVTTFNLNASAGAGTGAVTLAAHADADDAQARLGDLALAAGRTLTAAPRVGTTARTGLIVGGTTTFGPGATLNVTATVAATTTRSHGAFLTLDGPVLATTAGAPLTKAGAGTLGLTNPANAFGGLTVSAGRVVFTADGALGDAGAKVALASGATLAYAGAADLVTTRHVQVAADAATLEAAGPGKWTIAADNLIAGGTTSSTRTLTLTGAGEGAFNARVSTPINLVKAGTGAWSLGTTLSVDFPAVNVNAGTLRIASTGAPGNLATLTVAAGATLDLNGKNAQLYDLLGTGVVTSSAAAPSTLTVIESGVSFGTPPARTIFAAIQDGAGPVSLILRRPLVSGFGPATTSLVGGTYSGETAVLGSYLNVIGTVGLPNTASIRVGSEGTFVAGSSAAAPAVRDNVPLVFGGVDEGGGTVQLNGPTGTSVRLASATVNAGRSTLLVNPPITVNLTAAQPLPRAVGGALNVDYGSSSATDAVHFTSAPPLANGILSPGITLRGDWATVTPAGNLVPYAAYANANDPADASAAGWAAGKNVRVSSPAVQPLMPASRTVNSLVLSGVTTLTIDPAATLTIQSGGLRVTGTSKPTTLTGGTISVAAAAADLVIYGPGYAVNVASRIAIGPDKAVTLVNPSGGNNTFTLSNPANTFGDLHLTTGGLTVTDPAALGDPAGRVFLYNTGLAFAADATLAKPLVVSGGGASIVVSGSASRLTLTGGGTLYGQLTFNFAGGAGTPVRTLAGNYTGPGAIGIPEAGTVQRLELLGDNSFTGGVFPANGTTLALGSDSALGAGTFRARGTIEAVNGPRTFSNELTTNGAPLALAGPADVTFTGVTTTTNNSTVPVSVAAGRTLTLAGPLIGSVAGIAKSGPGTLTLGPAASPGFFGPLTVSAGALRLTGVIPNSTGVTVAAGATLEVNAPQTMASLTVSAGGVARLGTGGGRAVVVKTLQLTATATAGTLDLADGALVYDYASASTFAYVRDRVVAAYHAGAWDAPGIRTSAATADPRLGVGFGEAKDLLAFDAVGRATFLGQPVDATAVLVRTTLLGDQNLDGAVDFNDLVKLAQNYNAPAPNQTWATGDFTYDGVVDFNDLVKLAQNYNTALPAAPVSGAPAGFDADLAAALATVPEPSSVMMVVVVGAGGLAMRRRRRSAPRATASKLAR